VADILTLAALKAYALGRRAKWKDYIDLYMIMQKDYSIQAVCKKAHAIFGSEFNEKLFRSQLAYFKDVDKTEKVIYMKGWAVPDSTIQKKLTEISLQ